MFPVVRQQFTENSICHVSSSLNNPAVSAFPPMQDLKIQDYQRRWKLPGESHITLYPIEYKRLIKSHFSWQRKYLLMLLNELLSTLSENTRLKVISFLVVCFMCLTVSRSLFPTIKKDEVMRDDLSLPSSTNSDTLTVRNQRKHTNTTGKWKLMKTWLVACFFFTSAHIFLVLGPKLILSQLCSLLMLLAWTELMFSLFAVFFTTFLFSKFEKKKNHHCSIELEGKKKTKKNVCSVLTF